MCFLPELSNRNGWILKGCAWYHVHWPIRSNFGDNSNHGITERYVLFTFLLSSSAQVLLTLSQTTNFWLFQTERVCRRQFQIWWKWQKVLQRGGKHWEKEKLLFRSNFSFSDSVFKRLVLQTRWNLGLFGKGLTLYHTILPFNSRERKSFSKHCGKRGRCW